MEWGYRCNNPGIKGLFLQDKLRWKDFVIVVVVVIVVVDYDDGLAVVTALLVMTALREGTCHLSNCRHNQRPRRMVFRRGKGENKIKATVTFFIRRKIFCMCIQLFNCRSEH